AHARASVRSAPLMGMLALLARLTAPSVLIALLSYGDDSMALPRALDALALRHLERLADRRARLARVDHVVDHVVARRDVDVDDLAELVDQLLLLGRRVVGRLDLLAEDDLDRALGAHHADLRRRPRDDQVRLVGPAAHHVVARA